MAVKPNSGQMVDCGSWLTAELPFTVDAEEASSTADAVNNSVDGSDSSVVLQQLQDLLAECEHKQVDKLVRAAKAQQGTNYAGAGDLDSLACLLSKCIPGTVVLREGDGSRSAGACLRSLRHPFFILRMPFPSDDDDIIVDPYFREQFSLHQPTDRYRTLLDLLPEEFSGRPAVLRAIVELLGREIQLACFAKGTSLPPWRATKSLLSKWLPSNYHDKVFRYGTRQVPPTAAFKGMMSSSVPANPAHIVLGFSAPSTRRPAEQQQKRSRSLDVPMSALGAVSCHRKSQASPANAKAELWRIHTVKLGAPWEPQVDNSQRP